MDRYGSGFEAVVTAVGVVVILAGFSLLPGAPSFPGVWWQKLLIVLASFVVMAIGALLCWWSDRHWTKRTSGGSEQFFYEDGDQ